MFGSYIFLPARIDLFSTVVWGIVAAAIGELIAEAARGSANTKRLVSGIVLTLIVGTVLWLGWYNAPVYGSLLLGNLRSRMERDCTQGIDLWIKANDIQPKLGIPYLLIGNCYYESDDYNLAIQWLEMGKDYEPTAEILTALGWSYSQVKDYESAERNLKLALQLDPNNFDAQLGLGFSLHNKTLYDNSLDEFVKALNLNPKSPDAHFWVGWALYENGQYEEAIPHFQFVIEHHNGNYKLSRSHAGIGFCDVRLSNYGLARKEFEVALYLDPDQSDVLKALENIEGK